MSPLPVEALDRCADLPALICEFEPDSTLTYVNRTACDFFGMAEDELIGRRILDFVSPEARHSLWKRYLSLTPERPFAVSVEEIRRGGKSSWLEWRNRAFFDESGVLLFCRSVGIDITARRRMEETLRESGRYLQRMRQRMADGFWMVDIEGRILDVNDAYCRMTGYSRKELLSMRLTDLNPFDEPSVIKARIERVRLSGSDRFEIRQRCKDGSVLELEIVTAYMDVHGGRFVTIGRDISERKRMEEALLAAKENAECWGGRPRPRTGRRAHFWRTPATSCARLSTE